ncbi:MAG: hypothetical protein NUW08_00645, partial [Candidatus Uhrbacteria bacterium]|nr:hypothetical protein [Candidatus Uhrbacteria bacterium]
MDQYNQKSSGAAPSGSSRSSAFQRPASSGAGSRRTPQGRPPSSDTGARERHVAGGANFKTAGKSLKQGFAKEERGPSDKHEVKKRK